jgi:membrane-associated PAP2 superfamily phosphatase
MALGRHFLTDSLFAALFTLIIIWGMHWLIFKWRQPPDPS